MTADRAYYAIWIPNFEAGLDVVRLRVRQGFALERSRAAAGDWLPPAETRLFCDAIAVPDRRLKIAGLTARALAALTTDVVAFEGAGQVCQWRPRNALVALWRTPKAARPELRHQADRGDGPQVLLFGHLAPSSPILRARDYRGGRKDAPQQEIAEAVRPAWAADTPNQQGDPS